MARFLSAEWVERFNDALRGVDLSGTQGEASTVASERAVTVAQEVSGAPDGPVRTVLSIDGPTVTMALGAAGGDPDRDPGGDTGTRDADVTISLDYADAAALSRGELDPAGALGSGRVRVRGDLSVLVAAQSVLAAAAGHLSDLASATTY